MIMLKVAAPSRSFGRKLRVKLIRPTREKLC
jgi:hypothetical protein